jgi:hypothetical protein
MLGHFCMLGIANIEVPLSYQIQQLLLVREVLMVPPPKSVSNSIIPYVVVVAPFKIKAFAPIAPKASVVTSINL